MDTNQPQTSANQNKILVVEDEQYLRDLYVEILQREGYQVDQASDGEQGYQAMHKGGYDLVLLDLMLPKMDGFQILEKLKQPPLPENSNKAIVILTNLGKDTTIARGIALGARGYMIKADYTPDQILQEVKNYLTAAT